MKELIVVAGPTASGKSDFAVELALKNNGEIISCDSRQVYKGLDIGTGKITKDEMKGVKHYMLDIYNIGEDVNVSDFATRAIEIIEDIFERGKVPILCGGTGQYIQAIIYEDTFAKVEPNKKLRDELENMSLEELNMRLEKSDKERLKNIDTKNKRRLVRAIEIAETIGKVPVLDKPKLRYKTKIYLMEKTREELRKHIEARLTARLAIGMLEEGKIVADFILRKFEGKNDKNVLIEEKLKKLGIEYFYMNKYLKKEITEDEMKKEIINKSYQYAKRQMTWNKKYLPN